MKRYMLLPVDGPLLVILSTTYTDPVAAGDWRPELASIAASLVMTRGPDEP
jgi:hypothetical protein